ncbi:hypothetical protein [Corynebacterium cystitidis]|uniref:hypothetical protein n=1 Tax=Corynebacterium cystitidis TaxID=35757 RepID=UPI00211F2FF4|nr:hypothetical protein [Corynebacterium cystitidis]
MIDRGTIRAAHQELGLPTDDATIDNAYHDTVDAIGERIDIHFTHLTNQWRNEHPEAQGIRPGEVTGELWQQAQIRAEEEEMEERFNAPIRELTARKVEAGEDGW